MLAEAPAHAQSPLDDCAPSETPSGYASTCAVGNDVPCTYDPNTSTYACDYRALDDCTDGVAAFTVHQDPSDTDRVHSYGSCETALGTATFCCVHDINAGNEPIKQLTVDGTDFDDRISFLGNATPQRWLLHIPDVTLELNGNDGHDGLVGTPDPDLVDRIFGGPGRDDLTGLDGDDLLYGGDDDDELDGGDGDDELDGGHGNDVLYGREGEDWLYGGIGDDELHGNQGHDHLYGGDGDDVLRGGYGDDWLYGEDGFDTLYGGHNNDTLYGGNREDWIYGGPGDDYLYGGAQGDKLLGGPGADHLYGQGGNDTLYGGTGEDYLDGGTNNDDLCENNQTDSGSGYADNVLLGGTGYDFVLYESNNSHGGIQSLTALASRPRRQIPVPHVFDGATSRTRPTESARVCRPRQRAASSAASTRRPGWRATRAAA